jgi:heme o synthase
MLKSYIEALKPERTFFNVLMTLAGFLLACAWHINWPILLATLLGTSLLVMSGCLANNATDSRLDATMPRTKKRASATGEVPVSHLIFLAITYGVAGLFILGLWVNMITLVLGVIAYVDYVVVYAWTKRHTPWSTLLGTPAGALPLAAGYTAITGSFSAVPIALILVMVCWQMAHFYAIGIYRVKDYTAGGLPIWPVRYGVRSTQWWILLYVFLYIIAIDWLDTAANMGAVFFWSMVLLGLIWLGLGISGRRSQAPEKWARRMFGFSLIVLLMLAAGITVSSFMW